MLTKCKECGVYCKSCLDAQSIACPTCGNEDIIHNKLEYDPDSKVFLLQCYCSNTYGGCDSRWQLTLEVIEKELL
jgi:hypothetical protein